MKAGILLDFGNTDIRPFVACWRGEIQNRKREKRSREKDRSTGYGA